MSRVCGTLNTHSNTLPYTDLCSFSVSCICVSEFAISVCVCVWQWFGQHRKDQVAESFQDFSFLFGRCFDDSRKKSVHGKYCTRTRELKLRTSDKEGEWKSSVGRLFAM